MANKYNDIEARLAAQADRIPSLESAHLEYSPKEEIIIKILNHIGRVQLRVDAQLTYDEVVLALVEDYVTLAGE